MHEWFTKLVNKFPSMFRCAGCDELSVCNLAYWIANWDHKNVTVTKFYDIGVLNWYSAGNCLWVNSVYRIANHLSVVYSYDVFEDMALRNYRHIMKIRAHFDQQKVLTAIEKLD